MRTTNSDSNNHESDARLTARYLHLLRLVKDQQLALCERANEQYPDDWRLSALISQLNGAWTDLLGPLRAAAGIQPLVYEAQVPDECAECKAARGLCDKCWDVCNDELVTAVYGAARAVLGSWGIGVDSVSEYKVAAAFDEGLADKLWEWVQFHVPLTMREATEPDCPEKPTIEQATDVALHRLGSEVSWLVFRMGVEDFHVVDKATDDAVGAARDHIRQVVADALAGAVDLMHERGKTEAS